MSVDASLNSFDGTRIHYELDAVFETDVPGPDVLHCDGIGCDGYIWRYLRPRLRARGRVIHPHTRGHGRSGAPVDPKAVAIGHVVDDFRRVLDAVESRSCVMIGHSMGVQVALELWNRDRPRVAALVLLCGSYGNPASTFRDGQAMRHLLPLLRAGVRLGGERLRALWRVATPTAFSSFLAQLTELHPDFLRKHDLHLYLSHLAEMDPQVFFDMLAGAEAHSAAAYLTSIDVPTLVISGELDRFTPAWLSSEMAHRIPTAESVCVRDGTHASPVEHPMQINLRIERFIDEHFPQRALSEAAPAPAPKSEPASPVTRRRKSSRAADQ